MLDGWTHSDWIEMLRLGWEVLAAIAVVIFGVMNRNLRSALQVMATKAELTAHKDDHDEEHRVLDNRLADGDVRFARIETTLNHLPTRQDLDGINALLGKISENLARVDATVTELKVSTRQLVQNELAGLKK